MISPYPSEQLFYKNLNLSPFFCVLHDTYKTRLEKLCNTNIGQRDMSMLDLSQPVVFLFSDTLTDTENDNFTVD